MNIPRRLSLGRAIRLLGTRTLLVAVLVLVGSGAASSVFAQGEPLLGQLALVPYDFAPRGWAMCNGQIMSIAQNTALFSLLGTTFGGDGRVTFALPDLRGRVPISSGQGPGLANYALGERGGMEFVALTQPQMPAHTHVVYCDSTVATTDRPENGVPARNAAAVPSYSGEPNAVMTSVEAAGGNQPHENRPPYTVLNWIIAIEGIYPSRSLAPEQAEE